MEKNLAEGGGNAALVPAILDPFDDAVEKPPRVEMRFQLTLIIPRPHTEAIGPENQF